MSSSQVSTFKKFTAKLGAKIEKTKVRMHKAKSTDKHSETAAKTDETNNPQQTNAPDHTNKLDQTNATEPTNKSDETINVYFVGDEAQQPSETTNRDTIKQRNKAARRAARKEKWAARRTTFRRNARKVGKALMWPVVIVGGVILAPVYLVAEIVFSVLAMVVMLVVRILDLIFCGPVLACLLRKEW